MVKLQKLKADLKPPDGEAKVSNEAWAEAAGETVEDLKRALEDGEIAKEELGECVSASAIVCLMCVLTSHPFSMPVSGKCDMWAHQAGLVIQEECQRTIFFCLIPLLKTLFDLSFLQYRRFFHTIQPHLGILLPTRHFKRQITEQRLAHATLASINSRNPRCCRVSTVPSLPSLSCFVLFSSLEFLCRCTCTTAFPSLTKNALQILPYRVNVH